jgi:hypothetical protein
MSLLLSQIVNFFSNHEKSVENLKYKHKFNFFYQNSLQLPSGIQISQANNIIKKYFSDLKKKLKKSKKPNQPKSEKIVDISLQETEPTEDFFAKWKEDNFISHFISPDNYFNPLNKRFKIKQHPTLLYALQRNFKVQNFRERFESWISVEEDFRLNMNGTLQINLMDNSVMLAKVSNSRIKEFKLILNCGFYMVAEMGMFENEDVLRKLQVYFKGGFK